MTKRLIIGAVLALFALAAIPLTASATHAGGEPPKFEKADGTGESSQYGKIHVNADDNDNGDDFGHFFIESDEDEVAQGDVTCLFVQGHRAVLGGVVTRSTNPDYEAGDSVLIGVEDNNASSGNGGPDRHFAMQVPEGQDQQCNNPASQAGFAFASPVEGNYIVHDFSG